MPLQTAELRGLCGEPECHTPAKVRGLDRLQVDLEVVQSKAALKSDHHSIILERLTKVEANWR